jgi:GntR family transcriptional regulator/MocR family aminotransferase
MHAEELIITLNTARADQRNPFHRQVFAQIRGAVLDGRLRPADKLPSTRELAGKLGIARNTVVRAYEDLLAEGYLEGKVGSGTFVAAGLKAPSGAVPGSIKPRAAKSGLREPSGELQSSGYLPIDFRPGIPDWDAFPRALWHRLIGRALRANERELSRYGQPGGYPPLRRAIARHLAISRGVVAGAEQVVIVSGSQQALDLIARLHVHHGESVALEDPGYPEARQVLAQQTSRPLFIPVDEEGIDVGALACQSRKSSPPRLVYVTPSHQFPTGVTLSLARRLALLEWAVRNGSLIIEDDYDSEFHGPGRAVESIQGLDRAGRVLYIGTFSTVLFPPLRVGYVVLPPNLVEPFVKAKWLADRQTPTLEQLALTDFLEAGYFERHLRRMRRLVSGRQEALRYAIVRHFGGLLEPPQPGTGMHLLLRLPTRGLSMSPAVFERLVVARAAARGVGIYPVGPCHSTAAKRAAFLLGYAAMPEERIGEGISILAEIMRPILKAFSTS